MIKQLSEQWLRAKSIETEATNQRLEIEIELYKAIMDKTEIKREGSTNYDCDGYKINITSRMNITVNQEKAVNAPYLFKTKFEYSKTVLKDLPAEMQDQVHDYITIKPAKPTFSIKEVSND